MIVPPTIADRARRARVADAEIRRRRDRADLERLWQQLTAPRPTREARQ